MPITFFDPLPTSSTKSTMKKKSGRQFTEKEAAKQEEVVKGKMEQKLSIEQVRREKYDQVYDSNVKGILLILFYYYFY